MATALPTRVNKRRDPFTGEDQSSLISSEAFTVPASTPFYVRLAEIPRQDDPLSVTISGMTEVQVAPGPWDFQVDYDFNTAQIRFHSDRASDAGTVQYFGTGTPALADHMNALGTMAVGGSMRGNLPNPDVTEFELAGMTSSISAADPQFLKFIMADDVNWVDFNHLEWGYWSLDVDSGILPSGSFGAAAALYMLGHHMIHVGGAPTHIDGGGVSILADGANALRLWLGDGTGVAAVDAAFPIAVQTGKKIYMTLEVAYQGAAAEFGIGIGNDSAAGVADATPTDATWLRITGSNMFIASEDDGAGVQGPSFGSPDSTKRKFHFIIDPGVSIEHWIAGATQADLTTVMDDGEFVGPFIYGTTASGRGFQITNWEIAWKR